MTKWSMMSNPWRVITIALLMSPGLAWSDFQADRVGQIEAAISSLIQPPAAFPGNEQPMIMSPDQYDATRLHLSMNYGDTDSVSQQNYTGSSITSPRDQVKLYSATAVGEYAITEHIGVFGTFGLRYSTRDDLPLPTVAVSGLLQQFDHRYGVGVNLMASEILSLHFQWERLDQSSYGVEANLSNPVWDPWRDRSVFSTGVSLGF